MNVYIVLNFVQICLNVDISVVLINIASVRHTTHKKLRDSENVKKKKKFSTYFKRSDMKWL